MVWLSHPYMTTGKTIALTIWTCVSEDMSLLFNMLSRFVIAFLPRGKRLLTWGKKPDTLHATTVDSAVSGRLGPSELVLRLLKRTMGPGTRPQVRQALIPGSELEFRGSLYVMPTAMILSECFHSFHLNFSTTEGD